MVLMPIQQMDENSGAVGDITITATNHAIETQGTTGHPDLGATASFGIVAQHETIGNIEIVTDGGSVTTAGTYSYGLQGDHSGDGTVDIETSNGHAVTTTGANSHGIVAYHTWARQARDRMEVTVGGSDQT